MLSLSTKKGNKQNLNNYWTASLLTICIKLFEEIIFDTIFQRLTVNKLLNPNQSGFMAGDSYIHQLFSVTSKIYSNPSLEVWGVFLDISKAFDRDWHEGLICKIKCMNVKGDLLALTESFFFRKTTKSCSEWTRIWMADNQSWCSSGFSSWSIVY